MAVEEIETEAVVGEDGITVDLNLACDLTSGNLRLGTQTNTKLFLRQFYAFFIYGHLLFNSPELLFL